MKLFDQLVYSTVRVEASLPGGKYSRGSGFFCSFDTAAGIRVPAIVTNKHVIENTSESTIYITTCDDNGEPRHGEHVRVAVPNFANRWTPHPEDGVDLAALPMTEIIQEMAKIGKKPFFKGISPELWADAEFLSSRSAIEDIIMIGYPYGMWDDKNNLPVARTGITATPPYVDFQGKPEFLIDCACFPGSSGSPVFIVYKALKQKQDGVSYGSQVRLLGFFGVPPLLLLKASL